MKRVIAVLFILLLMLGCKKGEAAEVKEDEPAEVVSEYSETYKRVTAEAGLRMRDKPGLDGKLIRTLPHGSWVVFVEEVGEEVTISNVTGRWAKVYWKSMEMGWVFGGFLEDVEMK